MSHVGGIFPAGVSWDRCGPGFSKGQVLLAVVAEVAFAYFRRCSSQDAAVALAGVWSVVGRNLPDGPEHGGHADELLVTVQENEIEKIRKDSNGRMEAMMQSSSGCR